MRYDYATCKTLERTEIILEDCYATGDVLPGEFPRIEKRGGKTASWSPAKWYYVITLGDNES